MALVIPVRKPARGIPVQQKSIADVQAPQKVQLVNIEVDKTLDAQFNPTEFEEQLGVNYSKMTVPGLSHQVIQYTNTENVSYSLELFFDATDLGIQGSARILESRRFLYAACHPLATPGRIVGGGAPRILFIWPDMISLMCVMTKLSFKYTRFNKYLGPTAYTANVTLEEIRSSLVTMEEVLENGTTRGGIGRTVDLDEATGD